MNISDVSTTPSIDTLVAQYMRIERQPILKLEDQIVSIDNKKSIYSELKSKMTSLRTDVYDLKQQGTLSEFGTKIATSADEDIVTASGDGDAVNGTHLINISQLAKADTIVSDQLVNSDSTVLSSEGTGTKVFKITIDGEETSISVDLSDGEDNETILGNVIIAINNSDAETNASLVSDTSSTKKLVLRSDSTGETYAISISDETGTLLNTLGLSDSKQASDTNGGYIYKDSELNSIFELDGISIINDSNTVEDVLTGVTFNLKGTQDNDDSIQITIEPDKETIKENLETFFEVYNAVISFIKEQSSVDPETRKRGTFTGDFTFVNLRMNLRIIASSAVSSVSSGNPSIISEVGIEPDDNGYLSISNEDDLDEALDANVSKVEDLFNSTNGIANQIYDLLTPFTKTGGIIDDTTSTFDTKLDHIETRIENLETRLAWKEQNYRKQFIKLQEGFNSLTMQQQILQVVNRALS